MTGLGSAPNSMQLDLTFDELGEVIGDSEVFVAVFEEDARIVTPLVPHLDIGVVE